MKSIMKLILAIVLFSIFILFLKNQYSPILLRNATYGMPALIEKGEIKNLYIGSSMFRQGLDIITLGEDKNCNYILAYNGNQPVLEYRQLKYLIDRGVQIENLYVDMYVYSAFERPEISDEKIFLEIDLKEKWKLWNLISKQEKTSFADFWRMFITSNNELLMTWPINNVVLNSQFIQGGVLTKPEGASYEILSKSEIYGIAEGMELSQKEAIESMIQLCKDHNIDLCFVETPKFEKVVYDDAYQNAMKEYVGLLQKYAVSMFLSRTTADSLTDKSGVIEYNFKHYNAENFVDTIHLSYMGRLEFTKKLSEMQ